MKPGAITPLQVVEQGGQLYLGGSCRRFGCAHPFTLHDRGTVDGGGHCHGMRQHFGNAPDTPCLCRSYASSG